MYMAGKLILMIIQLMWQCHPKNKARWYNNTSSMEVKLLKGYLGNHWLMRQDTSSTWVKDWAIAEDRGQDSYMPFNGPLKQVVFGRFSSQSRKRAPIWGAFSCPPTFAPLPNTTNMPTWARWYSIRAPKHASWACLGFWMEGTYLQYRYAPFRVPPPI